MESKWPNAPLDRLKKKGQKISNHNHIYKYTHKPTNLKKQQSKRDNKVKMGYT